MMEFLNDLLEENSKLKDWLIDDCSCAFANNNIEDTTPNNLEALLQENEMLRRLLSEPCSCKG